MDQQPVFGTSVLFNAPPTTEDPLVRIPGSAYTGQSSLLLSEDILSKHLLMLGGSGCGKSNVFFYILEALRAQMGSEDVMIIFDTKGDYYTLFHRNTDYVIGNSADLQQRSYTWNIFGEILADGWDERRVQLNAREIAATLFRDRGSQSQPFFCNAARDLFAGILIHFIRQAKENPQKWRKMLNNKDLLTAIRSFDVRDYITIFSYYPDMRNLLTYFGDGTSNQALGVFAELNSMIEEYFVGILADHQPDKSISMRDAIRQKGGKAIFVEYDLAVGDTLAPIYRLLIDQALKEALSSAGNQGNVFVVVDEFKLLPKLQHIDDALNFGRGMGVKVIAGIQSIDQLYDAYGREKGAAIASGFGSLFAFHANDGSSRDYISERFGRNLIAYEYSTQLKNEIITREREGHTVENWDQLQLGLGQAVIGLGYAEPFLFQFDRFQPRRS